MNIRFRRAQVSSFIVVGLIIVIIAALLLYLNYTIQTQQTQAKLEGMQKFSSEVLKIKPYIQDCVKQQAVAALLIASRQDTNDLQQLNEIEKTISTYLNENIKVCTNFEIFKEYEIEYGNVNTSVNVFSENFVVKVEWPITVTQNDLVLKEDRFDVEFPLKLNDLYNKVRNVVDNENTMDISHILNQELNIEITGCNNGRVQYLVNDIDYSIDGNVFQFFFNEKIENLIDLFQMDSENKNKISFIPFSNPGKVIIRKENQEKRLMFEVNENNFIKGCDGERLVRHEQNENSNISNYNFYLFENNSIPAGVSIKESKKVELKRTNVGDEFISGFDVISIGEIDGELFIKNVVNEGIPAIYYNKNGNWEEIASEIIEGYVVGKINKIGEYALGAKSCDLIYSPQIQANQTQSTNSTTIVFVPFDYQDLSLFNSHIQIYKNKIVAKNENVSIYKVSKKGLNCLNLQECDISLISSYAESCNANIDKYIGLVGNSIVGQGIIKRENTVLVGSYSTTSQCENCNSVLNATFRE